VPPASVAVLASDSRRGRDSRSISRNCRAARRDACCREPIRDEGVPCLTVDVRARRICLFVERFRELRESLRIFDHHDRPFASDEPVVAHREQDAGDDLPDGAD
jgi:hypothetical protein